MNALAHEDTRKAEHISDLIALRTWDDETGIYRSKLGYGIAIELMPTICINEADLSTIETLLGEIDLGKATIQVINFASSRIDAPLRQWASGRKDGGLGKERVKHFQSAARGEQYAAQGWRPRQYRVFFLVHIMGSTLSFANQEKLTKISARILQTFNAIGTKGWRVTAEAMIGLLTDMMCPDFNVSGQSKPGWAENDLLNEQVIAPGMIAEGTIREIIFEGNLNTVARCFSVGKKLPEEWHAGASSTLIGDIFRPNNFCGWPVIQSFTFKKSPISADVVNMRAGRANKGANSPLRFIDPNIIKTAKDFTEVGAAMAAGETMVLAHYQLVLFAEPENIEEAEVALNDVYKKQGFEMVREDGSHIDSLRAALPFGNNAIILDEEKRFGRTRTIKLSNASTLMPLYGEWLGNGFKKPPLMLLAGRRGQLAGWTPFQSDANYNTCIVGQSGQGKSVAMQEIMQGLVSVGGACVVIDDGYSFRNSGEVLGGSHVDFGSTDLELNPFAAIDAAAMDADADFAETALSMLVNFISALCHPGTQPSDLERAILTDEVQKCWLARKSEAKIDMVIEGLRQRARDCESEAEKQICEQLITLLNPFRSDGAYGRMFSGSCSVRMDNDLMVFEMSHLRDKKQVQAASMILLIFLATQMMYHSPREKPVAVMVDEAWELLSGSTADFIEGVARRARKFHGALITATQGVEDYFRSPAAEAAWANSSWRLFLRIQDASIEALKNEKRVSCDPVLERGLQSLNSVRDVWSEIIVHGQSGWDITRLVLDPVSLAAYSSTSEDVAAINALMERGMTRIDAIIAHAKSRNGEHHAR